MLKFAYQGQPGSGGPKEAQQGYSDPGEKSSTHSHSGEGEDDSCCEVCHHRKRELSREKTRVNRARSRSRERIRGYVSSSDTSTAFSEESRSRTDTSSEDTSSLGCQHEERGRKPSRPDLTQCDGGETKSDNKENGSKATNVKRGFSLFKMFQKSRIKEKKSSHQCPVCGNEESESCCIANGADLEREWIGNRSDKHGERGKTSPRSSNGKSDHNDFINAWRYNDGSFSACESGSCYKSRYFSSDESSPPFKSRNRYRNNESDSECLVRSRKMQRTKSGSELCNLERNNNNVQSSKGRPMSRSCEKLQAASKIGQRNEDFGTQFTEVVLREQNGAIDKLQKRYRKKNRRSKSCEKLNITNSPQKQSYRNYDSDWECRPTVQTTTVSTSQSFTSKNRRKAISCERLSSKSFQTDLRQHGHENKRQDLEYKLELATQSPANEELQVALVPRAPIKHVVKEATVKKTRTMRSKHSPPDGAAVSRKFTTLPRQRSSQSDTENTCIKEALPTQCNREYNFNQNGCTDSDVTLRSRTLDHRLTDKSFKSSPSTKSFLAGTRGQETNRFNSLPHNATRCFQQNDDVIDYTAQLRQVSSAQREQLFSTSNFSSGTRKHRNDPKIRSSRGTTTTDSRLRENLTDYALPEDASVGSEIGYPSSSEDSQSLLETSIDSSNNTILAKHTRYTSLTSLSTTVSTTSEDSMDSGNGSLSDRGAGNNPHASTRHRYSPINADRLRNSATMPRPSRPPVVPQGSLQETSDYESDLNSLQGRRGSPSLSGQNSSREGSPTMGVYRPPRIRYVDF